MAANYGLPQRNLGTVSVIGPTRDGLRGRRSARCAPPRCSSRASSKTSTTRARPDAARLLRGARRRPQRRRDGDQEGVPAPRPRAAPGHQQRPTRRRRTSSRRRRRPTRCSPTPTAGGSTTPTATRACARAATRPNFEGFGSVSDLFSAFFGSGGFDSAFGTGRGGRGPARSRAATSSSRSAIDLAQAARGERVEVAYEADVRCEHCHGNGAEPGTPIVTCPRCDGSGQLQTVSRTALRPARADRGVRPLRRRRPRSPSSPARSATAPAWCASSARSRVDVPAGHRRRPADPAERARPRGRARRPERRPLRASSACARTSASSATPRTCTR